MKTLIHFTKINWLILLILLAIVAIAVVYIYAITSISSNLIVQTGITALWLVLTMVGLIKISSLKDSKKF